MKIKTGIQYLTAVFLALSVQANSAHAQDAVQMLSLDDCIKIGLNQSTQVLLSEDSVLIADAVVSGAKGNFLPNLALNGNYGYISGTNLLTTTVPTLVKSTGTTLNYELTSSINLYSGLSNYSTLKAVKLSQASAQFTLDRSKQQITFNISQAFLQIILDRRIVQYAKENLTASTNREEQLEELTSVGRNALSDLYQQQAETSSDKLYLIQSEDKLKNDVIQLLRILKISETDKYGIAEATPDTLPLSSQYQNVNDLITSAMQQRPDLKSSETNIEIGGWRIKEFESGYYPKISLQAGLVSNGGYLDMLQINGADELGPQESYGKALFGQYYGEVGLNLSWNIFDRLYNKTNVQIATINQHDAEIIHDDLTVQISSDIKQAYNDYMAALQQIETSKRGLFAAQQAFDVIQGKYNVGTATFVELSNAQVVLLQAEVSKAQADVSLALQKRIIDYYIGK